MKDLEKRLAAIEERNQRVEADKAWETSWTRRVAIATFTYGVVGSFLLLIDNEQPLVNALVPAIGYMLSTLALRGIRKAWQKNDA